MLLLMTITVISIFSPPAFALDVTYLSQTRDMTPYWHNTYTAAQAAAKDLGFNLTITEGQGHHIFQAEVIADIAKSANKPDLLIFHAYPQTPYKYFQLLEQAKIPFITYSNFINDANLPENKQLGRPQGKYKYWLSEHFVDNPQGATSLVTTLIAQAKAAKLNSNDSTVPLKVIAFSGDLILESIERSNAVSKAIKQTDNVILMQDIIANWLAEDAKQKFKTLYARHQGIDVVWASSDVMALGALAGAIELGLKPNENIFIGGFDWDEEAINKIKQKQLSASAGGQIYNIAWLLVRVYDHFNNQANFNSELTRISDKYTIIDQDNLALFEPLTDISNLTSVNFYCFTKTYTQKKVYDFSMNALLKQLNNPQKENCL